ncbi:YaaA family protein [Kocuria soli]|uniref:YaaA family protein n=1 Tax=Kocuria soli TaxID=2485125 RepID=UPI001315152A|nr:peroxide stress protein YaaA [Kocuria soli]
MLILLPPSETKTAPTTGDPVNLAELSWPQLTAARERALKALVKVSGQRNAMTVLGVGSSLEQEVLRNQNLSSAPTAPALEVYNGVLYDALSRNSFTPAQRATAEQSIVIMSALWGALRPTDRIPAYRLSGSTALRGLGKSGGLKMSTYWKPHLAEVLGGEAGEQLIVDCRSSTYASAFDAPKQNTVTVKVVQPVHGRRKVVSHNAKHTRGELARHLIGYEAQGATVRTAEDLRAVAGQRWTVELAEPSAKKAGELTVVLPEQG